MNALLLVDIQNDFLPGGALAVPEGDSIIPVANVLMEQFPLVVATKDWHPKGHCSFASSHAGRHVGEVIEFQGISQVLWPDHCVQGTQGAAFPGELASSRIAHVVNKGEDPQIDSYSGFFDNQRSRKTGLDSYLRDNGVKHLLIAGLATDYCVKFTVLDALSLGYEVSVVLDGIRGVNLQPGDGEMALADMEGAGAALCDLEAARSCV